MLNRRESCSHLPGCPPVPGSDAPSPVTVAFPGTRPLSVFAAKTGTIHCKVLVGDLGSGNNNAAADATLANAPKITAAFSAGSTNGSCIYLAGLVRRTAGQIGLAWLLVYSM